MASFNAGSQRGKDTDSGSVTTNRFSSSLLEPRDNTVADIWRYSQRDQQKFDPDAMNESVDRQREMRRNVRPTNRMSFGVMENSPVPRQETTSRVLNNERIRKSIGLLDQATGKFGTPSSNAGSAVARTPGSTLKHSKYTPRKPPMTSQFDVSNTVGVTPNRSFMTPATLQISRFDQSRLNASLLTTPAYHQDTSHAPGLEPSSAPGDLTEAFTSTNIQLLLEEDPGVAATEGVYEEFQSCLRRYGSPTEIFQLVEEYERACNEQVTLLHRLVQRAGSSQNKFSRTLHVLAELEQERKTWRLIGSLYSDRQNSLDSIPTMDIDIDSQTIQHSESDIMKELFENNASVRQDQLIVDWLERNAADQLARTHDKTEFYSKSVCWENTLHELQQKSASLSSSERALVAHLDPDAPIRENKPLADLDKEDEGRLLREVFMMIRAGEMDEAQRLCKQCGQAWRAATLEGWRLYHDQNMKEVAASGNLTAIEGNPNRDIWKSVCWGMAEDERVNVYERAIYAALSGNLRELLPVCEYWEDCLWAYFKVMVDQNVEKSIRERIHVISREMEPLPPVYQEKDLTPSRIFQEIQAHPSAVVEKQAKERHRVIQKYLILADLEALIEEMGDWLRDVSNHPSNHMVRFMAHIVLFLRSVGLQTKEEICVAIMEAFVKDLIKEKRIRLVATYAAQLPTDMQISWYASFLEGIQEKDERQHCLQLAEEMGLDVPLITKTVVENIRTREDDTDMGERTPALEAATSEEDRHKIEAIDWLVFDPSQRAEALKQSNAIIRTFLAAKKHDAAREVFSKIPEDSIDVIHRNWQANALGSEQLLAEDDNAVREYLCVKAYLNALDAFNDWFEHYHNRRPTAPILPDRANFHEKVRYEHEQKDHEMEVERWQHALNIQSQGVVDTINNVLLFVDGGWMVDQRDDCEEDQCRQEQLKGLRQLCIPMLCQLLHSVLHTTGRYRECIALADTIASEQYQLYKVFNCAEMQQFLGKLRESSLQLLDRDLDPLGYEIS